MPLMDHHETHKISNGSPKVSNGKCVLILMPPIVQSERGKGGREKAKEKKKKEKNKVWAKTKSKSERK